MTQALSDWASIAEIVSAIAIVASLLFVGLEVRGNTRTARATMLQQSVGYDILLLNQLASDRQLANDFTTFMYQGFGAVDEANRSRVDYQFAGMVRHWENLYLQHCAGYLSDEAWAARRQIIEGVLRSPGFSAFIASPLGGSTISGPFSEFAEQVRREQGPLDTENT
jgi:hypothetical protein